MTEPIKLTTPLEESAIRNLRVGRQVLLSGVIVTARDAAHRYLIERGQDDPFPFDLAGSAIYHCGPVVKLEGDQWRVVSAGPTTSMRMEMYQGKVLKRYGVGAIIGKGGMGAATSAALAEAPAVYLAAPSGAGALLAGSIERVLGVWKLDDFGSPEALWQLEVRDFPAVVAADCVGGNLFETVELTSRKMLDRLIGK